VAFLESSEAKCPEWQGQKGKQATATLRLNPLVKDGFQKHVLTPNFPIGEISYTRKRANCRMFESSADHSILLLS